MKRRVINKANYFNFILLFFCVIFIYMSLLGAPLNIIANAQQKDILGKSISATFDDEVDLENIIIKSWSMDKDGFSRVSKSKIAEFENYVKKYANNKYDLLYVINIAFYDNASTSYVEDVNGLKKIKLKMSSNGRVADGFCAVVYLDLGTHKTQAELMSEQYNREKLLSSATADNLSYLHSSISQVDNEDYFDLSFETNRDGVYLIFQIDTTFYNAQNIFLLIGLIVVIGIIILLITIIIKTIRNKKLQQVQERIRSNSDTYLFNKQSGLDIDGESIQQNNLTRKVSNASTGKIGKAQIVKEATTPSKTQQRVAPKLPSRKKKS